MKLNPWEAPSKFLCGNVGKKTQMGDFHIRKRPTPSSIYHNVCPLEMSWGNLSHQTCPITNLEDIKITASKRLP